VSKSERPIGRPALTEYFEMAHVPQLNGLLEVALYVDNVERSVQFYQTLFGFTIIASDERLSALGVAGKQVLLVCQRTASANLPAGSHYAHGEQHVAFAVPATEFDAWQTRLEFHGVAVEEMRQWNRGGRSLYFRDPDRHLIELASPGVWSIY
jgi:catechol 2,3-dioxygenase-like lactoylglutathione lyase family enzyme